MTVQVLRRHELHFRPNLISENRCFVCKRSETEIQDFLIQQLDSTVEKLDSTIADLEVKLQNKKDNLKSHLDEILASTIDENSDAKTSLAISDNNMNSKDVSHIRDLIDMRKEFSNCDTLSEVRTRIEELRKDLENDQIYEENRKINQENNVGKNSVWYSDSGYFRHVASFHDKNKIQIGNQEIEEILESLEIRKKERETHLQSIESQIELIKKSRHNKISRGIIDLSKISGENQSNCKIPIILPVCVICESLGWHESTSLY